MKFIEKYLDAFPFVGLWISENNDDAFYLKEQENGSRFLYHVNLKKEQDLSKGLQILSEDFSKRSFIPKKFLKEKNALIVESDDNNKENFNFFWIDLSSSTMTQMTQTKYCGVNGFSKDNDFLVYGDRYSSEQGKYKTKLYLKNLETGKDTLLLDDCDWEYRLGWSEIVFNKTKDKIYFRVDKNNMRRFNNIAEYDLKTKKLRHLLPKELECPLVFCLSEEVENDCLHYASDIKGYCDLYYLNLKTGENKRLTENTGEDHGIGFLNDGKTFVQVLPNRKEDVTNLEIYAVDGSNAEIVCDKSFSGSYFLKNTRTSVWLTSSSIDSAPFALELRLEKGKLVEGKKVDLFRKKSDDTLEHNSYRYVEYESFDGKKVPAFLSIPNGEIKGAVITSFYGGQNAYSYMTQIYAEMGIAHFSPAVRGSWEFSKEWRDLIKGDLGGDEILDVIWAAKYLEKELKLKPSQIGVAGGSHGGYATLRTLTLPADFKGQDSRYDFGFGVCSAGFADLEDFYHTSNIPDWLVDMLGPYEGNEELYRDRSPIHHFENLDTPIYILHGKNDPRVSPTSMEGFIKKLESSDKSYEIFIMEGQGHSISDRKLKKEHLSNLLSFIKKSID